jgi:Cu2+-exporting ATPase
VAEQLGNQPGLGIEARVDGQLWRLGQTAYVCALCPDAATPADDWHSADSVITLGNQNGPVAQFAIGDQARTDAASTIASLRASGLRVHLLSGDSQGVVSRLAQRLGCDAWQAGATPQDKLEYVAHLQSQGRRVLMVGDGINDAPVLARADISIAMGGGTDVARASGDLVLIDDRLAQIPLALTLARKTRSVIRQNLIWAAGYNLIALPLAVSGHVTPWIASLGMALSSLLVVSNALRLAKRNP